MAGMLDGELSAEVAVGYPGTFFVVVETTEHGVSESPNTFTITHLTDEANATGTSAAQDRDNDILLSTEWAANTQSSPVTVTAGGVPGKAVLIGPDGQGTVPTSTPTYEWELTPGASRYWLWVNDDQGLVFDELVTAGAAGCAGGGDCAWTATTELADGLHSFWIRAENTEGAGPWSDPMSFTVAIGQ